MDVLNQLFQSNPFDIQIDESIQENADLDERIRSTLRRAVQKRLIADPEIPPWESVSQAGSTAA